MLSIKNVLDITCDSWNWNLKNAGHLKQHDPQNIHIICIPCPSAFNIKTEVGDYAPFTLCCCVVLCNTKYWMFFFLVPNASVDFKTSLMN